MMGRLALRIPPSGSNTDRAPSGMPSPANAVSIAVERVGSVGVY